MHFSLELVLFIGTLPMNTQLTISNFSIGDFDWLKFYAIDYFIFVSV